MTFERFRDCALLGAIGLLISIVVWAVTTANATSSDARVIGETLSDVKITVDEHTKLDNARTDEIDRRVTVNESNAKHTIALLQELRQDVKSIMYTIGAPSAGR